MHLITDTQPGEPDILSAIRHEPLQIADLSGEELACFPAPEEGWSHEGLCKRVAHLDIDLSQGADAFLGVYWVGSTEV